MMEDPREIVEHGYDLIGSEYVEWSSRGEPRAREQHTRLITEKLPARAKVLELGCGAGIPTTLALAEKFRVTGVDISRRQIELARHNVPYARFAHTDMLLAEFPSRRFDAVTAFYSITHLPRRLHALLLGRIYDWLTPGGLFVASLGASEAEGVESDWLGVPMYFSHHDSGTNRALVEAAGLETETAEEITDAEDGEPVTFLWIVARKPCD